MTSSAWTGSWGSRESWLTLPSGMRRWTRILLSAAFDAIGAGALGFTVDVENRGAVDVDNVAAGYRDVIFSLVIDKNAREVDFAAEGFAFADSGHNNGVGTRGDDATGHGQHIGNPIVGGFEREAAGPVNLAEYGDLIAAHLNEDDVDLRLLHETTILEAGGNTLFGGFNTQAADIYSANQRVGDGAAFRNSAVKREVRILIASPCPSL